MKLSLSSARLQPM